MFTTFNRFGLAPFLFATDDSSGGGGTSEGDENSTKPKNKRRRNVDLAAESLWLGLVDEHGSEAAAGRYLVKRNHSFEEAKNDAETELADLKAKKPDEAAVKLTESERTELDAYRALGKTDELTQTIERAKRADVLEIKQACQLAGIDFADLSTRKGVDDWKIEIKTEEVDGKQVEVPLVTFDKDGKPETKPLADHAFATFPTLAKAGVDSQQQQQRGVTRVGGSPLNGGAPGKTVWDGIRAKKAAEQPEGAAPSWQEQVGARPAN